MDHPIPREAWLSSMAGRTKWTRPMLRYLIDYGQRGLTHRQLLWGLQDTFGLPLYLGEVVAEYAHLRTGGFLCFLFLSWFGSLVCLGGGFEICDDEGGFLIGEDGWCIWSGRLGGGEGGGGMVVPVVVLIRLIGMDEQDRNPISGRRRWKYD